MGHMASILQPPGQRAVNGYIWSGELVTFTIRYILYVDTVGHINRNYHTDSEQFEVFVTVEDMDIMMRVHSAGASAGVAACSAPSASAAGGVSSGGASRWTILPPGPYT